MHCKTTGFVAATFASSFTGTKVTRCSCKQKSNTSNKLTKTQRAFNSRLTHVASTSPYGEGAEGTAVVDRKDGQNLIHIVFVHPQIHWNTGNIGRTCLGLGATLHLVGPLGFSLDEKQIRRAGLDYWKHVDVNVHKNWDDFASGPLKALGGTRYFFTKFGAECATQVKWPTEGKIVLIFGSEVNGFDGIRDWLGREGKNERRVAFPMVDDRFRSFNLSTTASMVRYALL